VEAPAVGLEYPHISATLGQQHQVAERLAVGYAEIIAGDNPNADRGFLVAALAEGVEDQSEPAAFNKRDRELNLGGVTNRGQ